MPTFRVLPRFRADWSQLDPAQREAFRSAVTKFVADLKRRNLRAGLRVKGVSGAQGIFEMTWAPDGRATFEYGDAVRPGEPHIVWRRIGTHEILRAP